MIWYRKGHDFPEADAGAFDSAIKPMNGTGGIAHARRVKNRSLLDGTAHFAAAHNLERICNAAPEFFFGPCATGDKEADHDGKSEKRNYISHTIFS
jgi:hypothetical protein